MINNSTTHITYKRTQIFHYNPKSQNCHLYAPASLTCPRAVGREDERATVGLGVAHVLGLSPVEHGHGAAGAGDRVATVVVPLARQVTAS